MRTSCDPVDSKTLKWEQVSEAISVKLLNGSREEGAHTMLIRSAPREPNPPRGQYHPATEEFFGLGGNFTFDGKTWMGEDSYAFFPAYFVHGANVHVNGGYELYLRIGGTNEICWVEEPKSDDPYLVEGHESFDRPLQLPSFEDAPEPWQDCGLESVRIRNLRNSPNGDGSTLLDLSAPGAQLTLSSRNLLEVFALKGAGRLSDGKDWHGGCYLCRTDEKAEVTIECREPARLIVSHSGPLAIS